MKVWIIMGYDPEDNDHFIYEVWSSYEAAKVSMDRARKSPLAKWDRIRFNIETWSILP